MHAILVNLVLVGLMAGICIAGMLAVIWLENVGRERWAGMATALMVALVLPGLFVVMT